MAIFGKSKMWPHLTPLQRRASSQSLVMSIYHLPAGAKCSLFLLLAAFALNSYHMLLDVANGATHHLLQLTGTTLIAGPI